MLLQDFAGLGVWLLKRRSGLLSVRFTFIWNPRKDLESRTLNLGIYTTQGNCMGTPLRDLLSRSFRGFGKQRAPDLLRTHKIPQWPNNNLLPVPSCKPRFQSNWSKRKIPIRMGQSSFDFRRRALAIRLELVEGSKGFRFRA